MLKSKATRLDKSFILSCFVGGVVACIIDIIMSLLLAIGIGREYIHERSIIYITPVVLFIGTLAGMLIARKMNEPGAFVAAAITGALSFVIRVCIAMLFFDGIDTQSLFGMVVAICISLFVVYLLHRRGEGAAHRRTKKRRRRVVQNTQ